MTQTPRSLNEALKVIEAQKRVINSLEHEVHWYEGIIYNASFNEIDIRLIAAETPREMKMGISAEIAERKIYMPAIAEQVHASDKTVSKRVRTLEKAGIFSYRTAPDPDSGNTRAYLQPLAPLEHPSEITFDRTKPGGSTWKDGKRVKRCKDCGSDNLGKVTQVICLDCGSAQNEKTITLVNTPDSHNDTEPPDDPDDGGKSQYDRWEKQEEPDSHNDTEPLSAVPEEPTPDSHNDTEPSAPDAVPNVPPTTVSTVGVSTEVMEPPEWLRSRTIWCCHRAKVPFQPWGRNPQSAKSSDPATWGTYEQAKRLYEDSVKWGWKEPFHGIGLMCDGTFTVIDYDHCIVDGRIDATAWDRSQQINSYMEVSLSGTGGHQIARATTPTGRKRPDIEMYSAAWEGAKLTKGRFLTWTGNHIIGTPTTIEDRQEQITALYQEISPPAAPSPVDLPPPAGGDFPTSTDEEIIRKARDARNGAKFGALWEGDTTGYASHSNADQALCNMLAYWTDGNVDTIDRLFRMSGLMRPKWEREDYRERTINEALRRWALRREAA